MKQVKSQCAIGDPDKFVSNAATEAMFLFFGEIGRLRGLKSRMWNVYLQNVQKEVVVVLKVNRRFCLPQRQHLDYGI